MGLKIMLLRNGYLGPKGPRKVGALDAYGTNGGFCPPLRVFLCHGLRVRGQNCTFRGVQGLTW